MECPDNDGKLEKVGYEPKRITEKDDPITVATYAEKQGLFDAPGWKKYRRLATNRKKMTRTGEPSQDEVVPPIERVHVWV